MPHIPKAFCGECKLEMKPERNSVVLETILETGLPYYKIRSDMWGCPGCGKTVFLGMALEPIAEHYQPEYNSVKPDFQVRFS